MWEGKSLMAIENAEENVADCTMAFDLSTKGTHTQKKGNQYTQPPATKEH